MDGTLILSPFFRFSVAVHGTLCSPAFKKTQIRDSQNLVKSDIPEELETLKGS
jgi:hypothetical protein